MKYIFKLLFAVFFILPIMLVAQQAKVYKDTNTNKMGIKDKSGKIILPAKYDFIFEFEENSESNDYSTISSKYSIAFNGELFSSGYPKIGKFIFIDSTGTQIINTQYDYIKIKRNGFVLTFIGNVDENGFPIKGLYGLFDKAKKEIVPCKYTSISPFGEGIASVSVATLDKDNVATDKKFGLIDSTGKEIVACTMEYSYVGYPNNNNGLIKVKKSNKYGFINISGKQIIDCKYDYIDFFYNGLALVFEGEVSNIETPNETPIKGKYGFVNNTGQLVYELKSDFATNFYEGFAKIFNGEVDEEGKPKIGKYGLIDTKGNEIAKVIYDEMDDYFKDGKLKVIKDGKTLFINKNGKEEK